MSVRDCLRLMQALDPEDGTRVSEQQKELVAMGVPADEAWTQAAELAMESVLEERNALAAQVRDRGGYMEDLTIENLLNPASYEPVAPEAAPPTLADMAAEIPGPEAEPETEPEPPPGMALRDRRSAGRRRETVRRWVAGPMKRISKRVPINIVNTPDEIGDPTAPADAAGYIYNGQIYLISDNINNRERAREALEHEVVGHLGLEGSLGKRMFNELIGDMMNIRVEMMFDPQSHPEFREILDNIRALYVNEGGEYTLNPRQEAQEMLAHIAHSKPRLGPLREIWNKLVAFMKRAMARLGYGDPDMAMVETLLTRAANWVGDPNSYYSGGGDGAAMRVHHVSAAPFRTWERAKIRDAMGTGQKNYGFGHYFGGERAVDYFQRLFELEGRKTYRYEAWAAPKDEELMRWQDDYDRQPAVVQEAFQKLLSQSPERLASKSGQQMYRELERAIESGIQIGTRARDIAEQSGIDLTDAGNDEIVSVALAQQGVRGNKYLESFGRGQQAFNYVFFNDDDISMISRQGEPMVDIRVEPEPGMAMRVPQDDEKKSEQETELYRRLGLDPEENLSLWRRISNLRMNDIKELTDKAVGRGYEGLFDGLIEVKRRELEAGVGLGQGDYANSAYVAMRLATGVSDMMTHLLHYGSLQWDGGISAPVEGTRGFFDLLNDLGTENLNDWLVWMAGNRADELMAQDREHNLDADMIALAKTKNQGNEELFTRIKNEYNAMNKLQLDFAQEAGLINEEKRAEWESEWYVPFYRQTDDELIAPRTKRGLSHQSAGIRRLMGSDLPTGDLLENLLTNWIKLTDASVKNRALKMMVDNFVDTEYVSNESARFTKAFVPKQQVLKMIETDAEFAEALADWLNLPKDVTRDGIYDAANEVDADTLVQFWAVTAPKDPDVVRVQRDGKNEYYRVHVPGLLRATGHMEEKGSQMIGMKAARWFKQLLTLGVTASPDFMLRNFIRDAAHAWAINKDGFKFGKDSLKGLKEAAGEGPIHRAMMAAGASFQGGYVHGTDPEATTNILRRELEKAGLSKQRIDQEIESLILSPEKLKSVIMQGWQQYRAAGDKVENANRVATAEAGRAAGKPDAQWLFESKDLMDYSRRGNFSMLIAFTDVLPFLNARMQGLDKLGRAIKEDPGIVARKTAMIGLFSVGLALLNDDDERYQALPDWEKDAYWHFWVDVGGPTDGHYRIPKPFEIGFVAGTIPERMMRTWITDTQPNDKLVWSLTHGTLETLNINPIPQIALPVVEVKANRHFYFDKPIESMADKKVIPKERYNQFTSTTAIAAGDTALAEWLEISPKQLQHLWNGYTGTMGAYALQISDMIVRGAMDFPTTTAVKPSDVPIVRAVYQGKRVKGTQWAIDFYDRLGEVEQLYGTLQKYRKAGDRELATQYLAENKEKIAQRRSMKRFQKVFSMLRKQRERILADDKLSREEKYQQSQAVQTKMNALFKKIEAQTRPAWTE